MACTDSCLLASLLIIFLAPSPHTQQIALEEVWLFREQDKGEMSKIQNNVEKLNCNGNWSDWATL